MENKIISINISPETDEEINKNAGVMWEHNATSLVFNIDPAYVGDYRYYIEYRSLIGTKVRTEYLELDTATNTITYDIPVTMTSLCGVECFFNIVKINEDGKTVQVIKPRKFCLQFDYSPDTDNSITKVNDFSINALLEAIRLGTFKGEQGEKGEKGDKGNKGDKGDSGEITNLDSEMSDTSENPVQNKVVKAYVDKVETKVNSLNEVVNGDIGEIKLTWVQGGFVTIAGSSVQIGDAYQGNTKQIFGKEFLNFDPGLSVSVSDGRQVMVCFYSNNSVDGYITYAPFSNKTNFSDYSNIGATHYRMCAKYSNDATIPSTNRADVYSYIQIFASDSLKAQVEELKSKPQIVVDDTMSDTSGNPVQNKVIKAYVDSKKIEAVNFENKMPLYLFDGVETTNYLDADYVIANATKDTQYANYYHTPYIYLPEGTYTINYAYSYKLKFINGVVGTTVTPQPYNNPITFTITTENPYISFMVLCNGADGIERFKKISIVKGETNPAELTIEKPSKYLLENFDLSGYFPPTSHWNGKKLATIGDSITRGYAPKDDSEGISGGSQIENPYRKIVADNLKMEALNVAYDGATVKHVLGLVSGKNNQVTRAIDFAPDIVTIMLGVNDSNNSAVPLGTIDDEYDANNVTFYSGLGEIVRQIQTALPNTTIVLLSSPKNNYTVGQTKQNYFKAVKDVAEKYDVLFYDLHNGCGFNLNNPTVVSNFVLTDTHPNHRAHKVLGSRLTGFIAGH